MQKAERLRKYFREWEFVAFAVAAVLCLLGALLWLLALVKEPQVENRLRGGGKPPLPESRINYDQAYAMLDTEAANPGKLSPLFQAAVEFSPPARPKPPDPTPKPKPPTVTVVKPKPKPKPVPKPEPKPKPEPAVEAPDPEFFVYRGYRRDDDGEKVAILHNETTGKTYVLRKGKKFLGLLVSDFTNNTITFIRSNGRAYTLGPDDKLPYRPK